MVNEENEMQVHQEPLTANSLRSYVRTGGFRSYTIEDMFEDFLKVAYGRVGNETTSGTYREYELVRDLEYSYADKNPKY